jgi:osmotically-inducible protein OsmY
VKDRFERRQATSSPFFGEHGFLNLERKSGARKPAPTTRRTLMQRKILIWALATFMAVGIACSKQRTNVDNNGNQASNEVSHKDAVKRALEQADLTGVTVTENKDKNTITLGGKVHSENAKQEAAQVAQSAAGDMVVANEVLVETAGQESESRKIQSHLDSGIEKNFKAAIESKGLDKQHIRADVKNSVLTLKGSVKNPKQKDEAQQIAQSIPNVGQVLNQIEIQR